MPGTAQHMRIVGKGHPNVTASHATTIAFTSDSDITPRGDCFAAVACVWEETPAFLEAIRTSKQVTATIECLGKSETITGAGHPRLSLSGKDLVIRKSSWVDGRTLMISADKAAKDLSRELVHALQTGVPVTITVRVE